MGFWKDMFNVAQKLGEKVMLIFSGVQIGDNANDGSKVAEAIQNYEMKRSAFEQYKHNDDSKTLQYIVLTFIAVVVIFILVIGVKMMLSKREPVATPSIALTTLREGPRTVNNIANPSNNA